MKPENNFTYFIVFLSMVASISILSHTYKAFKNYKVNQSFVEERLYKPGNCVQFKPEDREEWHKPKEELVYLIIQIGKLRYRSLAGFPSDRSFTETDHSFWLVETGMEAVECPEMFKKISEELRK